MRRLLGGEKVWRRIKLIIPKETAHPQGLRTACRCAFPLAGGDTSSPAKPVLRYLLKGAHSTGRGLAVAINQ